MGVRDVQAVHRDPDVVRTRFLTLGVTQFIDPAYGTRPVGTGRRSRGRMRRRATDRRYSRSAGWCVTAGSMSSAGWMVVRHDPGSIYEGG
jgi:hypothetical protein